MAARLTPAEAKALGLAPTARKKQTGKRARAAYWSRCVTCDEEFRTEAAEERHLIATHHARYEMVVTIET